MSKDFELNLWITWEYHNCNNDKLAVMQMGISFSIKMMMMRYEWMIKWMECLFHENNDNHNTVLKTSDHAWTFNITLSTFVIWTQGVATTGSFSLSLLNDIQLEGGFGRNFGEGGSLNLAPAYPLFARNLEGDIDNGDGALDGVEGLDPLTGLVAAGTRWSSRGLGDPEWSLLGRLWSNLLLEFGLCVRRLLLILCCCWSALGDFCCFLLAGAGRAVWLAWLILFTP